MHEGETYIERRERERKVSGLKPNKREREEVGFDNNIMWHKSIGLFYPCAKSGICLA